MSLLNAGWEPVLVGRRFRTSEKLDRDYRTKRLKLLFNKGAFFYACFNVRLFLYLLVSKADLFLANDLDTLPAVWLASKIRRLPYVFDSHEYFTEVPELVNRGFVRRVWKGIERFIVPKTRYMLTVNQEIADLFEKEYHIPVHVLMNVPRAKNKNISIKAGFIPDSIKEKIILIYQGAVNEGRGLEEMLAAMPLLPDHSLLIIGSGDRIDQLKGIAEQEKLDGQVYFTGRLPMEQLSWYTNQATIGLSLEQDLGLNYRLALPNKLFDYMQAGLPVLASDLPVMGKLVKKHNIGVTITDFEPESIARKVQDMTSDSEHLKLWRESALKTADKYLWESQESVLINLCTEAVENH